MIHKNIIRIRKKLDKLDDKFLSLIKQRTYLVDQVLASKHHKKDIIDNKRIKKILQNIYKKSRLKKIDVKVTRKIWVNMIRAYIDYEYRNFKNK